MKWRRNLSRPRRWQKNHLVTKYGAVCYICNSPFEKSKDITFDHWVPVTKGGEDKLENYRLAHYQCNQLKGNMEPDQFLEFQRGEIVYE